MAAGNGTEPNLTPFIDLFSVLTCFLLMTTAWLALETFPISIEKAPDATESPLPETQTTEKEPTQKIPLGLTLMADRVLAREGNNTIPVMNRPDGTLNEEGIKSLLNEWRKKFPNRRDLVLSTEKAVTYGRMIAAYDLLVTLDWPDVGINPN